MEYVYSALVLHAAGKTIDDDAIANVLRGAGMEPDPARIKAVTASLEGINSDEAIASAAVAPVAVAPAAAPAEETKEAPKEEEKKPEVSEEEAAAGLSALFD